MVFTAVYWPYVHLRGRHGWSAAGAKAALLPLILAGLRDAPKMARAPGPGG